MPILITLFILGAIIGSFLNVVVFRLGTGERIGNARSRCFSCGTTLRWHELIPLLSFIIQKGRCRKCGSKIAWQYPVVEFLTGTIFALVFLKFLNNFQFFNAAIFNYFITLVIFSLLIAISVYDYRHKIIPNQLVYPFIIFTFLSLIIQDSGFVIRDSASYTVAGLGGFLFFASLWFVSKGRWMGFGDAKLAFGIGLLLGPLQTLFAITASFWLGTLIAVPVTLLRGGGLKTQIPFGPFLAASSFITWMWGEQILDAYASLLL